MVSYWLLCGSFLAALTFHLCGSLVILVWLFWQEDVLVDWHGNLMLAALALGVCGAASSWLP